MFPPSSDLFSSAGFEIEQPDGRHTIDVIDMCLSVGVLPQCLHGMAVLLQLIQGELCSKVMVEMCVWHVKRVATNMCASSLFKTIHILFVIFSKNLEFRTWSFFNKAKVTTI